MGFLGQQILAPQYESERYFHLFVMLMRLNASIVTGDLTPSKNSDSEIVLSNLIIPYEKISVEGMQAL